MAYKPVVPPAAVLAALLAVCAPVAAAQTVPAPAQAPSATRGCLRGAPLDRCRWFTITDAGLHYRLTDVVPGDERLFFGAALGVMVNTGPRTAIGGEGWAGGDGEARGGIALRFRRWMSPDVGLDLVGGVVLAGEASAGTVAKGSPMGQVRVSYRDLVAASARLEVLSLTDACRVQGCATLEDYTSKRLYIGGEFGSGLGIAALIVAGAVFGIWVAVAFGG